ncbi:MAG: pilus assembly protein [Mariprofundus sp.]
MNDRCGKRNRGAALVEFAIIVPILLVLMFAVSELGRVLYQQNTLTKSVAAGARYLARSFDTMDREHCTAKPAWSGFAVKAKNLVVYGTVTAGATPLVPNLVTANVLISHNRVDKGGAEGCVINVTATALFAGIAGDGKTIPAGLVAGGFADVTLNAASEERYIGQ